MWKDTLAEILYYPIKWYNIFNIKKMYGRKNFKNLKEIGIPLGETLIVSPHVDDETIGLGGLLLRNGTNNDKVDLIYLTDSSGSKPIKGVDIKAERKAEAEVLVETLGIRALKIFDAENNNVNKYTSQTAKELEDYLRDKKYENVFIVTPYDSHYEHRWCNYVFRKALEDLHLDFNIYQYEVSSFLPDHLVNSYFKINEKEKEKLFKIFKSQKVGMDFDIFLQLEKYKGRAFKEKSYVELFSNMSTAEYKAMMDGIKDKEIQKILPRRIANHRTFYKVLRDNREIK